MCLCLNSLLLYRQLEMNGFDQVATPRAEWLFAARWQHHNFIRSRVAEILVLVSFCILIGISVENTPNKQAFRVGGLTNYIAKESPTRKV